MSDDTPTEIRVGDCMDEMQAMDANSVHSVVTDPPYNFEGGFMGEEWDNIGTLGEYREWCEAWATECLRVLKPGGHLIAFSGSRTHSHLFCGVHDAGFEIRDTLTWHYSSGYPRGPDIGEKIDEYGGNADIGGEVAEALKEARERRGLTKAEADEMFCDGSTRYMWFEGRSGGQYLPEDETFAKIVDEWPELKPYYKKCKEADREVVGIGESGTTAMMGGLRGMEPGGEYDITAPETSAAEKWDGWKQNLKPATEFAILARNPLSENAVYKNVLEHGTGALNISATEIEGDDMDRYPSNVAMEEGATEIPERYFYTSKASKRERTINGQVENGHNTVKPLDLMEWLVALVTAPGQRVLDPFAGSGTTIMACKRLGREGIGIEKDEDHAELARKRVELAHELETDHVSATDMETDETDDGPATLESFGDDD